MFELISTPIEDLYVTKPRVFCDHCGFFLETYQKQDLLNLGLNYDFVQGRHFKSKKRSKGIALSNQSFIS